MDDQAMLLGLESSDDDDIDDEEDDDILPVQMCNLLETKFAETGCNGVLLGAFLDVYKRVQPRFLPLLSEILYQAVARGNLGLVQVLLDKFHQDININHRSVHSMDGGTLLTTAARVSHQHILRVLLDHGARVNAKASRSGETALELVCAVGHVACVDVLLSYMLNRYGGDTDGRNDLLYNGMITAAYNGHDEVLRRFVAEGVDVNLNLDDEFGTPLHRSIEGGSIECTDIILNAGADVEALRACVQQTPLMRAAEFGHVNIISRLLNRGAKIDRMTDECSSALNMACHYGHTICVKYLLERGADPQARNPWGFTPLFMGADTLEIVQVLVEKGVYLDEKCGERGEAAIHLASVIGSTETVKLLLEKGSDINVQTDQSETALWLAAWKGHVDVCRLLLQRNCTVDDPSNGCQVYAYDYMPLEIAMGLGHMQIMRMLMLAGCSLCNKLYFKEGDNGVLEDIYWVKLRPEPLHIKLSNESDYKWFHHFVTNPRSLKHLCRLRLRGILGVPLDQQVSALGIPEELKDYLNFSDIY